jgi:xylulokinase
MSAALGIDVGTSCVRAAVVDGHGKILSATRRALSPTFAPGRAEQDPAAWIVQGFAAAREAVAIGGVRNVDALAVGAVSPAPVLVDAQRRPLTPALLYSLDRRAELERARLELEHGFSPGTLTHDHALPKLLWWCEHHPELVRQAAWALDATGFVVAQLTGGAATLDAVTAQLWQLADVSPPIPVPQPASPFEVAGGLASDAARSLGLPQGTPVLVSCCDSYVDLFAAGLHGPGDGATVLGTTIIVAAATAVTPPRRDGLAKGIHLGSGTLVGGWPLNGGSILTWLAQFTNRPLTELQRDAAALSPGADGVAAQPYFEGERSPFSDPDARGALLGLTLETTPVAVYRALVDALALSTREHVSLLHAVGCAPTAWRAWGGGVDDEAWMQATADAIGAPISIPFGATSGVAPAVLALSAVDDTLQLPVERVVEPDAEAAERYAALAEARQGLRVALAPFTRLRAMPAP